MLFPSAQAALDVEDSLTILRENLRPEPHDSTSLCFTTLFPDAAKGQQGAEKRTVAGMTVKTCIESRPALIDVQRSFRRPSVRRTQHESQQDFCARRLGPVSKFGRAR